MFTFGDQFAEEVSEFVRSAKQFPSGKSVAFQNLWLFLLWGWVCVASSALACGALQSHGFTVHCCLGVCVLHVMCFCQSGLRVNSWKSYGEKESGVFLSCVPCCDWVLNPPGCSRIAVLLLLFNHLGCSTKAAVVNLGCLSGMKWGSCWVWAFHSLVLNICESKFWSVDPKQSM